MTYQELLTSEFISEFVRLSELEFGILVDFSDNVLTVLTSDDKLHIENINVHLDVAANYITISEVNVCSIVQFIINSIIG